jgi:hypothetical protein
MADFGFPELLTLVQTIAIIVAIIIAVYFSRRQLQALTTDLEARVVNDLDEKLHRIGEIFMEKPEFVRVLNDAPEVSNFGAEVAFAFLLRPLLPHATTRDPERQRLGGLAAVDEERLPIRTAGPVLEGSRDASVGRSGVPGLRRPGDPSERLAVIRDT